MKHVWFLYRLLKQQDPTVVGIAADYVEEHDLWAVLYKIHARISGRSSRWYMDPSDLEVLDILPPRLRAWRLRYQRRYERLRFFWDRITEMFARQIN